MLQAVPARRFSVPNSASPLTIYRALRRINPSPHLFAVDLGPGRSILGASPELLVRVHDGRSSTRPLAGTRPRSDDPVRDAELERGPARRCRRSSPSTRCSWTSRATTWAASPPPGSVEWPLLYGVERYSHVMHIVSEVRGRLRADRDAFDAVRATFPAGTLSGAPKVRAMQAIAEMEEAAARSVRRRRRAIFAPDDVEVAITIRSVVLKRRQPRSSTRARASSPTRVPARESAEVAAKAGAVLAALAEAERRGADGRGATHDSDGRGRGRIRPGDEVMPVPGGASCSLDNYDSFTYNLYQYLLMLGAEVEVVRNDEIDRRRHRREGDPDGIVISPGPSRPEHAGITLEVIRRLGPTTPILGVCLGHQAIGHGLWR